MNVIIYLKHNTKYIHHYKDNIVIEPKTTRKRRQVCTQVPKYVILTDLPRYAAIAFTVIFFCTCSGGLNILQSESLIISSTAMRGKIPCLWQVRATEISTEKTSEDSATKHITLRLPDYVMVTLESDSTRLGISVNSLSNNILKKWARWDRHVQKLEMVAVPKDVVAAFVPDYDEKQIYDLVDGVIPFFQEAVILIKGKYDLKRCIETLDDYMQSTGIVSDHTMEGAVHCFTIQHGMGNSWSIFIKIMLGRLFSEFVPDKKVKYDVRENIISVRVSLGSDWDEHDY